MKIISFLAVFVAFVSSAQPPPANPLGLRPPGSATAPPVPVSPPTEPPVPLAPGPTIPATNAFNGFALTNQFGTNFTSGNLPVVLANLQNDLNQALPLLAAFNANVLGGNLGLQTLTAPVAGTAGGAGNLAQNFGTSSAANLAANLAANVATPTAQALATPPTGVTNAFGLSTSFGGAGTNSITQTVGPDAARLLVVLENDMGRLLPELAVFTGGAVSLPTGFAVNSLAAPTNPGGTFVTNQFVFPRTTSSPTRTVTPQRLTPTGR